MRLALGFPDPGKQAPSDNLVTDLGVLIFASSEDVFIPQVVTLDYQ